MPNSKINEVNRFAGAAKGDETGVSKPSMNGAGNVAPPNARNSASPPNPGGLNLLKKIKSNGSFKTSK